MKQTQTKPKLNVDLHSRKYRMLLTELILFTALIAWSNAINFFFPVTTEAVRAGNYLDYLLFSIIGVFLLGGMFFVLGAWMALWRYDRHAHT